MLAASLATTITPFDEPGEKFPLSLSSPVPYHPLVLAWWCTFVRVTKVVARSGHRKKNYKHSHKKAEIKMKVFFSVFRFFFHRYSPFSSIFLSKLRQDPLDLSFWSFLTFLHHDIENVLTHLLWEFHKKIQRKSWSNVSQKFLAFIRFLYKVVYKNGRLRKFNHSRETEFNVFTAWTIFMKLGTFAHHGHGYKKVAWEFRIFVLGLGYGLSNSKKRGKIITELWKIITKSPDKN